MIATYQTAYDVALSYNQKKILISLPNGERAMVRHKNVTIVLTHLRTRDFFNI